MNTFYALADLTDCTLSINDKTFETLSLVTKDSDKIFCKVTLEDTGRVFKNGKRSVRFAIYAQEYSKAQSIKLSSGVINVPATYHAMSRLVLHTLFDKYSIKTNDQYVVIRYTVQGREDTEGAYWTPFDVDHFAEQTEGECYICGEELSNGWLCLDDSSMEVCDKHIVKLDECNGDYFLDLT